MKNKTQIALSAGRPVLKKAGVGTHVIMRSFLMGESIDQTAIAFGVDRSHVEQAIRYELALKYSPMAAREILSSGVRRKPRNVGNGAGRS